MIIAVDYDGTLDDGKTFNLNLVQRLKQAQRSGDSVILWTCREGRSLEKAVSNLRQMGFIPNAINNNVPEGISRLGYNSRKILADVYIDDKSAR